jgi:menaquinone-dependent protoporphyrinogen oxidase
MLKQIRTSPVTAFAVIFFLVLLVPATGSAFKTIPGACIEKTCGEDNLQGKQILVAYDTKYGATRTVAAQIQDVLCDSGARVDMTLVERIDDISEYDAVVLGSAIISESWRPGMLRFLRAQEAVLATKQVAVFIVCGLLHEDTAEYREIAQQYYIDKVLEKYPQVVPVGNAGLFAGVVDYSVLQPLDEFLMRVLFARLLPEGDYRNFDKVTQWTDDIYALIE